MTQFPDPVALPEQFFQTRKERKKDLLSSCTRGILIRLLIIFGELLGVLFFESSALLMDALASLVDVVSTFLLIICIRLAARPPDKNHPFGHGRFEPLIGLQLGIMMALIGAFALVQQTFQLAAPSSQEGIYKFTWLIPLAAVLLLEVCYQIAMRAAKRQNSPALAVDAVHYRMDALTSLFAAIALIIGAYYPEKSVIIDHVGAIFIAILMIILGVYASKQNLNQLVDRAPEEEYFEKVRIAALKVKGVLETEKIRIQQYGPDAHIDIDIEVDPSHSVEIAHEISQQVRRQIQKEWTSVRDVTVHIEPYYPNDH